MCKYTSNPYCHGHELVTQNLEHSCNQLSHHIDRLHEDIRVEMCLFGLSLCQFSCIKIIVNMLYSNTNYMADNSAYFHNNNKTASAHVFLNLFVMLSYSLEVRHSGIC